MDKVLSSTLSFRWLNVVLKMCTWSWDFIVRVLIVQIAVRDSLDRYESLSTRAVRAGLSCSDHDLASQYQIINCSKGPKAQRSCADAGLGSLR